MDHVVPIAFQRGAKWLFNRGRDSHGAQTKPLTWCSFWMVVWRSKTHQAVDTTWSKTNAPDEVFVWKQTSRLLNRYYDVFKRVTTFELLAWIDDWFIFNDNNEWRGKEPASLTFSLIILIVRAEFPFDRSVNSLHNPLRREEDHHTHRL